MGQGGQFYNTMFYIGFLRFSRPTADPTLYCSWDGIPVKVSLFLGSGGVF